MSYAPPALRRVAAAVFPVRPADVQGNAQAMIAAATGAAAEANLVVFPELCVTGATCGDLFLQKRLLDETDLWIAEFLEATAESHTIYVFGAPVRAEGRLYDAAYVAQGGKVIGVAAKCELTPDQRRWFAPASVGTGVTVKAPGGERVPFGAGLVFRDEDDDTFSFAVELDRGPAAGLAAASAGALVLCLPTAEPALADATESLAEEAVALSRRLRCACVLANAGCGESTSDCVYAGDTAIASDGELLREGQRFAVAETVTDACVNLGALEHRRRQNPIMGVGEGEGGFVAFSAPAQDADTLADGLVVDPHPFVPDDPARRDARCAEVFAIQSNALATRLRNTGLRHVVLGLSGGLDSTLALLVCHRAFQIAGLPPEGIHLFTMPGFGTGVRTRSNADALAEALELSLEEISVAEACALHLRDIGHDGETPDAAYENSQARERTQILMDKANQVGGIVVGTGDLSELALGWCTFGGDQLSMYAVNADVPKTLVQAVVAWYADQTDNEPLAEALRAVVETPISPELLPPGEGGEIAQRTEDLVGPYELHDFFLHHFLRDGADPDTIRFLAGCAFRDTYGEEVVDHWLQLFLQRFFSQQFKRVVSAEGPRVLAACLDPRGGWRMPGDVRASAWLD